MWWTVLPSYAVVVAALVMNDVSINLLNRVFLGTPYKRTLRNPEDNCNYLRDLRISGRSTYSKEVGLENLK